MYLTCLLKCFNLSQNYKCPHCWKEHRKDLFDILIKDNEMIFQITSKKQVLNGDLICRIIIKTLVLPIDDNIMNDLLFIFF